MHSIDEAGPRRRTYLILDPHDAYAIAMMQTGFASYGIKPVAIFTDPKMRSYFAPHFPALGPDLYERAIDLDGRDLVELALELSNTFDIIGVVPFLEFQIEQLAPVVDALGVAWNSSDTLARCRNKHALKQRLAEHGVAVPRTIAVDSVAAAVAARDALGRFVLKPNAGYSNQNIGFFDTKTDDATLAKHIASGAPFVAEEYVSGNEYSVNGQVDENGAVHVLAIFDVERVFANGREGVYRREWNLRSHDDRFGVLSKYAAEVLRGLDVRSIPFHLEIRLSEKGPRLIDVGARLVGNEVAFMIGRLHSGSVDAIHLALRGYLGLPCAPPVLNWDRYDAQTFMRVYGCASREELIASVDGREAIEQSRAFVRWILRPTIGQRVVPTLDLDTFPYAVDLLIEDDVDVDVDVARELADSIERTLTWNTPPPTAAQRAIAHRESVLQRVRPRARWAWEQVSAGDLAPSSSPPPRDEPVKAPTSNPDDEHVVVREASSPQGHTIGGVVSDAKRRLKLELKRRLWPTVRPVVTRHPEPSLDRWNLAINANGRLSFEGVDLAGLAKEFGSPLYVVLDGMLKANAKAFLSATNGAPVDVTFSYKTNPVPGVCRRLAELGIGAECISPYELWLAFQLGVAPENIIYGGPAKSDESLRIAIEREIRVININHPEEIERVERVARAVGKKARVGLRVTPPGGWTGQFGAAIETGEAVDAFKRALESDVLEVIGLHVHRGMLIRTADELDAYLSAVLPFAVNLVTELGVDLKILDLGGSLAIPTVASFSSLERRLSQTFLAEEPPPDPDATLPIETYVQTIATAVEDAFAGASLSVPRVALEPGRAMTGTAQILLTSVITTKEGIEPPAHAVLDGGINVAEPAQFEYHRAVCATRASAPTTKTWRLVGPACTPGDLLFLAWPGPELEEHDVIAILDAGAYFVPFSTTFSFPRPGIVTIEDGKVRPLRRPESFSDLIERDAEHGWTQPSNGERSR